MDLFIQAFLSFGSYILLTYFIYSILNRNRTIPLFIFGMLLISQIVELIRWIQLGAGANLILFGVMVYLLPVILAFIVFMRVTGGFGKLRITRRKPIKGIKLDVQTVFQTEVVSLILSVIGILFGILGYFFISGWMKWMILACGMFVLVAGLLLYLKMRKVMSEKVLLIIGKQQKVYYDYDIPKHRWKIQVNEFFKNENYIVDPIGIINFTDQMNRVSIYYLYWIATQDIIDMKSESNLTKTRLFFEEHIEHFEKYHYRILHLKEDQKGHIEVSSIKQIK